MKNLKSIFLPVVIAIILVITSAGCRPESTVAPESAGRTTFGVQSSAIQNTGSLTISSAKFLFSDVSVSSTNLTKSSLLSVGPVVGEVNLDGTISKIVVGEVPAGSYQSIYIAIENNTVAREIDPEFTNPNADVGYSMVIKGTYNNAPFVYKSSAAIKKDVPFSSPVNIAVVTPVMLVIPVATNLWFMDGSVILNPNDPANQINIDKSIVNSIGGIAVSINP